MPDTQQPLAIRAVRLQQIGRPEMPGEATLQAVCEAEDIGQPLRYSFKLRWNQVVLKEYPFSESNRMKAAIHLAGCYEVECTVRTADGSRQGKASAEPVWHMPLRCERQGSAFTDAWVDMLPMELCVRGRHIAELNPEDGHPATGAVLVTDACGRRFTLRQRLQLMKKDASLPWLDKLKAEERDRLERAVQIYGEGAVVFAAPMPDGEKLIPAQRRRLRVLEELCDEAGKVPGVELFHLPDCPVRHGLAVPPETDPATREHLRRVAERIFLGTSLPEVSMRREDGKWQVQFNAQLPSDNVWARINLFRDAVLAGQVNNVHAGTVYALEQDAPGLYQAQAMVKTGSRTGVSTSTAVYYETESEKADYARFLSGQPANAPQRPAVAMARAPFCDFFVVQGKPELASRLQQALPALKLRLHSVPGGALLENGGTLEQDGRGILLSGHAFAADRLILSTEPASPDALAGAAGEFTAVLWDADACRILRDVYGHASLYRLALPDGVLLSDSCGLLLAAAQALHAALKLDEQEVFTRLVLGQQLKFSHALGSATDIAGLTAVPVTQEPRLDATGLRMTESRAGAILHNADVLRGGELRRLIREAVQAAREQLNAYLSLDAGCLLHADPQTDAVLLALARTADRDQLYADAANEIASQAAAAGLTVCELPGPAPFDRAAAERHRRAVSLGGYLGGNIDTAHRLQAAPMRLSAHGCWAPDGWLHYQPESDRDDELAFTAKWNRELLTSLEGGADALKAQIAALAEEMGLKGDKTGLSLAWSARVNGSVLSIRAGGQQPETFFPLESEAMFRLNVIAEKTDLGGWIYQRLLEEAGGPLPAAEDVGIQAKPAAKKQAPAAEPADENEALDALRALLKLQPELERRWGIQLWHALTVRQLKPLDRRVLKQLLLALLDEARIAAGEAPEIIA